MNFAGLVKRDDKMDRALEELQADMAEAFDESLDIEESSSRFKSDNVADPNSAEKQGGQTKQELVAAEISTPIAAAAASSEAAPRLTLHSQSRLAALASFDKLYQDANEHLRAIDERLSEVTTSYQLTRKFFSILHSDIHRTNGLELANANLMAEQKKWSEQLQDANRRQQESESAVEALRAREARLTQDNEALRTALAAAKMDLVESSNTIARNETELGDLVKTLSARVVDAERRSRENEVLREKHVNLSIDLDKALRREAEARRQVDELSTIQTAEAAQHAELLNAFGKSEQEVLRLQKAIEIAEMKQADMTEAGRIVEAEREAEIARILAEASNLRSEIQSLRARLELAAKELSDASGETAKLKFQLSEAVADRQVVDEKISTLVKESENDKMSLLAASANISQLSLHQASEQIQLDIHKQQCEDLRAEISTLHARIKELLPYERLYRVAKARQRESRGGATEMGGSPTEATRPPSRRTAGPGRRRAL